MKICIYSPDTCLYYKEKLSYKKHEKWDPCLQKYYHEHYKTKIQNICIEKGLCVLVAQSCPTLCNPIDYSPPGSPVHRILQARVLEWAAISFFFSRTLEKKV